VSALNCAADRGGERAACLGRALRSRARRHFCGAGRDHLECRRLQSSPGLRQAEIERAKRKRPENLDAYDLYLRAPAVRTPWCFMPGDADKGAAAASVARSRARIAERAAEAKLTVATYRSRQPDAEAIDRAERPLCDHLPDVKMAEDAGAEVETTVCKNGKAGV